MFCINNRMTTHLETISAKNYEGYSIVVPEWEPFTGHESFLFNRLCHIRNYLKSAIDPQVLRRNAILVVGSDGRLENAKSSILVSPIEFCVLGKNDTDYSVINTAIIKGIKSKIIHAADSSIEWKNLSIR